MRAGRPAAALALGAALLPAMAAAQPAAPEEWWRVETPSFTLYSDADPERAAEIATALERLREAFARLAPEVSLRSPVPTRIVAFRDAGSFAPYKTIADRGRLRVLGQFLGHRDGNFITVDADPGRLGALATIQHEFVHDLVQHNFPSAPLWFNEGLAEYYSTFAIEGGAAFIGRPVERHLRWLRTHPDLGLGEVLAATRESARRHGAEASGRLYAVSWLLVHYLLSGDGERLDAAAELLYRLDSGEDPEAAVSAALGVDTVALAERLAAYLLRPLARAGWKLPERAVEARIEPATAADLLVHLGDLQLVQQRVVEAERHYGLALAYDGSHAGALSGLATVRDLDGRLEEAGVLHREATAAAGRAPAPFLRYGRHLLARAQAAEAPSDETPSVETPSPETPRQIATAAREALATAARLAPAFAECRALLGASHLLPGGDPEEGIGLLEQVRRELPRRADVAFNLLQLYLADGRLAPAAALADGALARLGDPELLARAREAVERTSLLEAANRALADGELAEGLRLLDLALEASTDPEVRAAIAARRATVEQHALRPAWR